MCILIVKFILLCHLFVIQCINGGKHLPKSTKEAFLLDYANNDMSRRAFARDRDLAESTLRFWEKYVDQHGSLAPQSELYGETRGRNRALSQDDVLIVLQIIAEDCTLYYYEIADELVARGGTQVHPSTIARTIKRFGLSRKRIWK